MAPTTRRAPDTTAAREALHRALRPLDSNLDAARSAARAAVDAVPYTWQARHCAEYRRTAKEDTYRSAACTRCTAFKAGDPMPLDDY